MRGIITTNGNEVRYYVVADMKLLMKHVESTAFLTYAWEHEVNNRTTVNVISMSSKNSYWIIFLYNQVNHRIYENNTWKPCLNLIIEMKRVFIGELYPLILRHKLNHKQRGI